MASKSYQQFTERRLRFPFLGCKLNNLELRTLKRMCDNYGIDYMEIDNTLTYYENKKHLLSLIRMLSQTLDVFEMERMAELQEQYMKDHFLCYYIMCRMAGETRSEDVGEVSSEPQMFSLKAMAPIGFSLNMYIKHKSTSHPFSLRNYVG